MGDRLQVGIPGTASICN